MSSRRRRSSRASASPVVTAANLLEFKGYSFVWFADAALQLTIGATLEQLGPATATQLLDQVRNWVTMMVKSNKLKLDQVPWPLGLRDRRVTLSDALSILGNYVGGGSVGAGSLPSALSIDFAEHVRIAGGRGPYKRDVFKASDEVVALACVGALLTQAYRLRGEEGLEEYGYVFVRLHPQLAPLSGRLHPPIRYLTGRLARANVGFFPIVIGVSAAVAVRAARLRLLSTIQKNPVSFEYLRLVGTEKKVMAKGFDSIDITGLVKMIGRSGAAGAIVQLLKACPEKAHNKYRSLVQNLAHGLAMYYFYGRPIYLYGALRLLSSAEVQREGLELLGPMWSRVAQRLTLLSRLVT